MRARRRDGQLIDMKDVGDMGQIHQHLVLFNHVAMGHEALFLVGSEGLKPERAMAIQP